MRPRLGKSGITFNGSYLGELMGNTTGGRQKGGEYAGLLMFNLDFDAEKLADWTGATLRISAIYPHGGNIAQQRVGDLGGLSNIEAYDSFRLAEVWLDQKFLSNRASIRIGLMTSDTDFYGVDTSSLFINSDFGAPAAETINFPMPSYPFTAPGIRLRYEPDEKSYIQFAAYDGNPAPGVLTDPTPGAATSNDYNKHNTRIALRSDEGAMFFAEIGWHTPKPASCEKKAPLATCLKLGGAYHTDRFADIGDITLGVPHPRSHRGDSSIYISAEQDVWREPGSTNDGLAAFLRFAHAPADRNLIRNSAEAGLTYRGIFQSEARDTLALGVAWLDISPRVAAAQRTLGSHAQDYETAVELTYQRALTPWCSIQPDLQYIIHPGGSSELGNALVIGLRTTITF